MDLVGLLKSQFLCHLVFCYVFIASGLIINAIQLFTLLLWPINKQLFRKINCRLSYCVSSRKSLCVFFCILTAAGSEVGLRGAPVSSAAVCSFLFLCFKSEMAVLSSV